MNINQNLFDIVKNECGLVITQAHKSILEFYIEKRCSDLGLTQEEFCTVIQNDQTELSLLIDQACINETYFFREQIHFDFLRDYVFSRNKDENLAIWSAACSTGEEPVAIYSLAKSMDCRVTITASDIDRTALSIFDRGEYTENSFRPDGSKFHQVLKLAGIKEGNRLSVSTEVKMAIRKVFYNLISEAPPPVLPQSQDIVFLRNLFINLSRETRIIILRKISQVLKCGGLMFLSVSEIAGIHEEDLAPLGMEKICFGGIYFLRKTSGANASKVLDNQITFLGNSGGFYTGNSVRKLSVNIENTEEKLETIPVKSVEQKSTPSIDISQSNLGDTIAIIPKKAIIQENNTPKPQDDLYKKGIFYLETEDKDQAYSCFRRALNLDENFWPALFQMMLLDKKLGRKELLREKVSECTTMIKNYIKEEKACYNYTIEQFNPQYFLEICEKIAREV